MIFFGIFFVWFFFWNQWIKFQNRENQERNQQIQNKTITKKHQQFFFNFQISGTNFVHFILIGKNVDFFFLNFFFWFLLFEKLMFCFEFVDFFFGFPLILKTNFVHFILINKFVPEIWKLKKKCWCFFGEYFVLNLLISFLQIEKKYFCFEFADFCSIFIDYLSIV